MSELDQTSAAIELEEDNLIPDELALLKEQANVLGIKFNANIGLDKLRAKVLAVQKGTSEDEEEEDLESTEEEVTKVVKETETQKRTRIAKEALQLVRVQVTCLDPGKASNQGELITVCNKYIKRMCKFVLFNKPYHIPQMMLDTLKEARFTIQVTEKRDGREFKRMAQVPKYSVEILPALTESELARLAKTQALRENDKE